MAQRILLVDDDADIAFLISEFLRRNGYEVSIARDGEEALEKLRVDVPDLIIADLTMPKMSGWHFTQRIRSEERLKGVPIIVLSGLLESDSDPETFEAANAYISKPFDIHKLHEKREEIGH